MKVTDSFPCGQVEYEFRGQPRAMYYCSGSLCRKATGSSFATNMLVAEGDFVVTAGASFIKAFQSSAWGSRFFCSACGSPIYSRAEVTPLSPLRSTYCLDQKRPAA